MNLRNSSPSPSQDLSLVLTIAVADGSERTDASRKQRNRASRTSGDLSRVWTDDRGGGRELTVASTTDCPTDQVTCCCPVSARYRSRTRDVRRLYRSLSTRWKKKKIGRGQNRLTARTHTRRIRPRTDSRVSARTHAGRPAARSSCAHIQGVWWACLSDRRKRSAVRLDFFLLTTNVSLIGTSSWSLIQKEIEIWMGDIHIAAISARHWHRIKLEIEGGPPCMHQCVHVRMRVFSLSHKIPQSTSWRRYERRVRETGHTLVYKRRWRGEVYDDENRRRWRRRRRGGLRWRRRWSARRHAS